MASNKYSHLTISDRQIIETGIKNNSSKKAIAKTIGKDNSTIAKEIKEHRTCTYKCNYPLECLNQNKCVYEHKCNTACLEYKPFICKRRDRSPGACNGCTKYTYCRFTKYKYVASDAQHEYKMSLSESRIGVNATVKSIKELGERIKPLLDKGQSVYSILLNNPDIPYSAKTIYTYIEDGIFTSAGIAINNLDLKRQVRRRINKEKKAIYAPRKDRAYLKGRTYKEFEEYKQENPNASIVQMDTVYNDISNGPFIQTFKFMKYDFFFCLYKEEKTSLSMYDGILLIEKILGKELFEKEVNVLLTDRGSEFTLADKIETRNDGTIRTRIFYCDPMASRQKGSLENNHLLLREICPKEVDLYKLGFDSQEKANLICSHINSYPKEKLNGKSPFELLEFLSKDMYEKFLEFGLCKIEPNEITLKPYLLKNK